jgi:hypothetical protein
MKQEKELRPGTPIKFVKGHNPDPDILMHGTIVPMPVQMMRWADTHYAIKPSPVHSDWPSIVYRLKDEVVTG